jgi:hypothetical protein
MIKILGIKITDRIKEAGMTQKILTRHSSAVITRLGFHEVTDEVCSREAYIILHLDGEKVESETLRSELEAIGGLELREARFNGEPETHAGNPADGTAEIMCLLVERDTENVSKVQKILTSYGCNIRTRLGVNESFFGQPAGLLILELKGDVRQRGLLENAVRAVSRVHVRTMFF